MTNEELQKAFEAGYAAAKALYSLLEKEGIEVTEAEIRRIVEEVIGELADNGQIGSRSVTTGSLFPVREIEGVIDYTYPVECVANEDLPDLYTCVIPFAIGKPTDIEWTIQNKNLILGPKPYKVETSDSGDVAWIGNPGFIGMGEDDDSFFAILVDYGANASVFICVTPGSYELSGSRRFYEYSPISLDFLPGVCLPVVELETVLSGVGVALTEAESVALTEVLEQNVPCIARLTYIAGDTENTLTAIPMMSKSGELKAMVFQMGNATVMLLTDGTTWTGNVYEA